MRFYMQEIYTKQQGLTPEEEQVISFLGSQNDHKVMEELDRRKLSSDERDSMEGPITKQELTTQLMEHMKTNSAPKLDGFTVAWVRQFWGDLANLCVAAVNKCYDEGELTRMLKTPIMKLLKKGRNADWRPPTTDLSPSSVSFTRWQVE